jgi:serine/threonine-protein kinase
MGEVYKAEDLRLDLHVALKFLSESVQGDAGRLERFYNEVRLARQITHPAVCRVHDLGELEGLTFLSMEYVDGEDLASLLKRIGCLPAAKGLETARQICAGLAAAHARGVLHRDLKPANVMLDGQGHARITDFGLAGLGGAIVGDEVRSGTPAYMSPEQLEGRDVTVRSDLYALGLVLYELFTGRRVFHGRTVAELTRQHREEPPAPPSELVADLDPRVEAVILRCLEKDPSRRPASALAVSAALPGGDPLAEALAAGQTPSPELVAAAGESEGGLTPGSAWGCVALAAVATLTALALSAPLQLSNLVPTFKAPAVLEDRARQALARLGYAEAEIDAADGFVVEREYLSYQRELATPAGVPEGLRSGAPRVIQYYRRTSPRPLLASSMSGRVFLGQPPMTFSGMTALRLDTQGRLTAFYAIPPQTEPAADKTAEPAEADWNALFDEAGLEPGRFRPARPAWTPPYYADARRAWQGAWPERPELALRIEAAAHRGKPVMFALVSEWTRPEREQSYRHSPAERLGQNVMAGLFVAMLLAGGILARRNLILGRGDRRGAFRLALFSFGVGAASWALDAHHVPLTAGELELFTRGMGLALFLAAILWLFYLAIEPYVRRLWPKSLVSWTRLLATGPRDPLVARDTLLGLGAGSLLGSLWIAYHHLPRWLGAGPAETLWRGLDALLGLRYALGHVLDISLTLTAAALASFLALVLLRLLLRSEWAAAAAFATLLGLVQALRLEMSLPFAFPLGLLVMGALTLVAVRWGLLAFVMTSYVMNLLLMVPATTTLSGWAAGPMRLTLAVLGALTAWALHVALHAPRPAAR